MTDDSTKLEGLEAIKKQVSETLTETTVEEAVNSNVMEFEHEEKTYRVRKPNFREKKQVHSLRVRKYTELLKNDDYLLHDDLIALYKKRGTDVELLDKQLVALEAKKKDLQIKLGKAIKDNRPDQELVTYKVSIENIITQQTEISLKKINLFQYSIETQVNIFACAYLAYLVSEIKIDENNWKRVFKTYEKFEEEDSALSNKLLMYATLMINHELSLE